MVNYNILAKSYYKKRILITGHTGFKGSWLGIILKTFGAELYGISISTNEKNLIYGQEVANLFKKEQISSILDFKSLNEFIQEIQPDYIFHLAAQPLVSLSFKEPISTIETNVLGLANVLEVSRHLKGLKSLTIVTTDKVYYNEETGLKFKESDRLGGKDIYSGSKVASEIISESYFHAFYKFSNIQLLTVRSGNVIGGGDFCDNRIVPDIIRSIMDNKQLTLRSPESVRPWLHVLESLFAYCYLALLKFSSLEIATINVAPIDSNKTVRELVEYSKIYFPSLTVIYKDEIKFNESINLNLDGGLIVQLGFKTKLSFESSLNMTFNWYKGFLNGENPLELCMNDIKSYISQNA